MMAGTLGAILGGLIGSVVVIIFYFITANKRLAHYDERQKMLRGKIAQHTLGFAVALLLISGGFI